MGRRTVSNVPAQALILMNDPFVHQQARLWGRQLAASEASLQKRVEGMYLSALGRPPCDAESSACRQFLAPRVHGRDGDIEAWADLAHVMFNLKEFIFLR
jgi:hypothetical protein